MARDHTRINLDIWGDDEFRELPVDAQALYWALWTSPARSYCGTHEWRPGRLTQTAGDWTLERLRAAAAVLSEQLFLIIDETTEECLLRSWIKHDGLWKQPNMAVSMAMARAAVASKVLRGVIVHEVKKLVAVDPDQGGWKRDEVAKMLTQHAVDPASLTPFDPGPNPGGDPLPDTPANPYGQNGVDPHADTPPTTATSTTTTYGYIRGGVSEVPHLGADQEPSPLCSTHQNFNGTIPNCTPCGEARKAHSAWKQDEVARKRRENAAAMKAMKDCTYCDEGGWVKGEDGKPIDPATKCIVHEFQREVS